MPSESIGILKGQGLSHRGNAQHVFELAGLCAPTVYLDTPSEAGDCAVVLWLGGEAGSAVDAERLLAVVQAGSSVIVTLEGLYSAKGLRPLLEAAGITAGDRVARVVDTNAPHRMTGAFAAKTTDHEAVRDLGDVSVYGAVPVAPGSSGEALITSPGGEPLAATAPVGAGRLVVIGDGDILGRPFIAREDNARVLVSILAWLLGSRPPQEPEQILHHPPLDSGPPSTIDVSSVSGHHLVDCSDYREELEDLAARSLPDPYQELEAFIEVGELTFHRMPQSLREAVLRFRRDSNDYGAMVIRGLPSDSELPPTPADAGRVQSKPTHMSELWTAAIGTALGDPVSFAPLKAGEIFMNICPTRRNEGELSSESSRVTLDYHTELAYHPHAPTHLLLFCLRPDHDRVARTFFSCARQVVDLLSPDTLGALFEPSFRAEVDLSFRGQASNGHGGGIPLPVFYGDPYDPLMNFDGDLIAGVDERARRAYSELTDVLIATQMYVELNPGDLLILDNRRTTHGRSEFTPRYDGLDRWLQRMYIGDLNRSIGDREPGSRVIHTEFAA